MRVESPYRENFLLSLFTTDHGSRLCRAPLLGYEEWGRFAARVYAESLSSDDPSEPQNTAIILSMDAGARGWDDHWKRWGYKAHDLGDIDMMVALTDEFASMVVRIKQRERTAAASSEFRGSFEDCLGMPLHIYWDSLDDAFEQRKARLGYDF